MVQYLPVVIEPEQQRSDGVPAALVPAEPGDHALRRSRVFDLDHRALARLIGEIRRFRDYAVETRAFEAGEPVHGERAIARHRRQVNRRADVAQQLLELLPALALRRGHLALAAGGKQIEADE